uniref:Uncharacterized protein n=1 Tax=Parascaris univalens TaxID=6257 RepID=A0A915BQ80_PARUN
MATAVLVDVDANDPPHSPESLSHNAAKRVSFDEHQVKTFVYEKETNDLSSEFVRVKQPFTDLDAPPSRVTVIAEQSELPSTILPPAQVEDTRIATVSPQLPALMKRMENETENPFRPEETLFHEVDPIVEAYMKKPYPPSLPGSQTGTPVKSANPAYINGISPSSLVADKDGEKPASETTPLTTPVKNGGAGDYPDMPKASQVECVRIEKKKKCGCCSVQ